MTTAKKTTAKKASSAGFSAEERAAMKERAKELRAQEKGAKARAEGEADIQAKFAEMSESDRALAETIHRIVAETAPQLLPRTWYGMPAYADDSGKAVCYFKPSGKFGMRYSEFGFNPEARLDDGTMWPIVYAVTGLDAGQQKFLAGLVAKAVG